VIGRLIPQVCHIVETFMNCKGVALANDSGLFSLYHRSQFNRQKTEKKKCSSSTPDVGRSVLSKSHLSHLSRPKIGVNVCALARCPGAKNVAATGTVDTGRVMVNKSESDSSQVVS